MFLYKFSVFEIEHWNIHSPATVATEKQLAQLIKYCLNVFLRDGISFLIAGTENWSWKSKSC